MGSFQYPHISFHIQSQNATEVIEGLKQGTLDFGLIFEPFPKEQFAFIDLPSDNIGGILMRQDDAFATQTSLTLDDLKQMPLICPTRRIVQKHSIAYILGTEADHLNFVASYSHAHSAAIMVEEGVGNAIIIDHLVDLATHHDLVFVPILPVSPLPLSFVWKRSVAQNRMMDILISEVQQILADAVKK